MLNGTPEKKKEWSIVGWWTRNDKTADYLRSNLYTLLTQEGIRALESKKMLDVINNDLLDRYRVPGAHTGFIPFSVATEAKEYIEKSFARNRIMV